MGRKLALFADGTGNAFTQQESNVWRLYQALDQSQPDQLARYIPGVGTSGFRPLAILDGATGFGVPSNVRKLYRFLCWNWRPGDEIHLFGFSRGAFTIRTLVGLINSQGLVPAEIGGKPVSRAEMDRNVMAAWRAYREGMAGRVWRDISPLVWLTRKVRNGFLALYRTIRGHQSYETIRQATVGQRRIWRAGDDRSVRVTFLGLFDTVEAYGVPIEELRRAIDWAIWPISFRNRRLSGIVERACHALALDDERVSFHPLRFDMSLEVADESGPRITEVWFAGVHSDVGGGYPESALAQVPLRWMSRQAGHAIGTPSGAGLRFTADEFTDFEEDASPLEPVHDSRAGLAVFYRYGPRPIGTAPADGGAPVIHHSVAEKMVFGSEGYAPITLPTDAYVLMPDGSKHAIRGFGGAGFAPAGVGARTGDLAWAQQAVAALRNPSTHFVELTRDLVWWRRVAYMAMLIAAICMVALPVTAAWLSALTRKVFVAVGLEGPWNSFVDANSGVGGNLNSIAKVVGGFLPDYAGIWIAALVQHPIPCLIVVGVTYLLYRTNARLRDSIGDAARLAWFPPSGGGTGQPAGEGGFARRLRRSDAAATLHRAVAAYILPGAFVVVLLAAILGGGLVAISRSTVTYREAQGSLCAGNATSESRLKSVPPGGVPIDAGEFDIAKPCWASAVRVEKGIAYRLTIDAGDHPFFDRTILADAYGFTTFGHVLAVPIRRWWSAAWFQPIAKIGARGLVEWPLVPVDKGQPTELGSGGKPDRYPEPEKEPKSLGPFDPLTGDLLKEAEAAHRSRADLRRRLVSEFVAEETGELYLYLNDAIVGIPFAPDCGLWFYANNAGKAAVSIKRIVP